MTPAEVARLRSIIAGTTPGDRPDAIRAVVEELHGALSELAGAQREVTALRAQVADLTALAAAGQDAERAAVIAWLRSDAHVPMWRAAHGLSWGHVSADAIERGAHVLPREGE